MADEAGVMDVGIETGGEIDSGAEVETRGSEKPVRESSETVDKEVDGRKYTKEYRDWLKSIKADPAMGRHAKTAYNDHGRMLALQELEDRGVDGVREKYALLESVGGAEGLQQLQTQLQDMEAVDNAILAGDPKSFELLGEDFKPGLLKLAPHFLDFIAKSDPQVYAEALQPHLFGSLIQAPLTQSIVSVEQILTSNATPEQKLEAITAQIEKMGQWYQEQKQLAGAKKEPPKQNEWEQKYKDREEQDSRTANERVWKEEITPPVAKYESERISQLAKPYGLKVDADGMARFRDDVKAELSRRGKADAGYMKQMGLYQKSKQPNAQAVQNYVKSGINKHVKASVEAVMNKSPWKLLRGKSGGSAQVSQSAPRQGSPVQSGTRTVAPTIVGAKPSPNDVDWGKFNKQSSAQKYAFVYPLKNGRVVQWKH